MMGFVFGVIVGVVVGWIMFERPQWATDAVVWLKGKFTGQQ